MRTQVRSLLPLVLGTGLAAALGIVPAHANPTRHSGDSEALAVLAAADEGEVQTAKQALSKGVDGAVRDYAQMLQKDHAKNLQDTRSVAAKAKLTLAETDEVKKTKKKGQEVRQKLQKLSGDAYSHAYVEAMVKDHTEDLDEIDHKLIPEASNADVLAHLKATRATVARHLEVAKSLQ
jgi:putative membrane protein